jgi:hypothetical protein
VNSDRSATLGVHPFSASRPSRRKRRVTLAPPMCLHLRHSFEGIILGFASGRKRLWRSTIRLRAITDRPEVSVLSLRVRLDPERERRSLIGHDWQYGAEDLWGSPRQPSSHVMVVVVIVVVVVMMVVMVVIVMVVVVLLGECRERGEAKCSAECKGDKLFHWRVPSVASSCPGEH